MALESKMSELEARLKAENEAVMQDRMSRSPHLPSPATRRQRSQGENGTREVQWPQNNYGNNATPMDGNAQPQMYCDLDGDQHRSSPQMRYENNSLYPRSPRSTRPSLNFDTKCPDPQGPGRPQYSQGYPPPPKSPGRPPMNYNNGQEHSSQIPWPNYNPGMSEAPRSPHLTKQTMRLSILDSQDGSVGPSFYIGSGSPSPGRMPHMYDSSGYRQFVNGPPPRESPSPGGYPRYIGQYEGNVPPRRLSSEHGQPVPPPRNSPSPGPCRPSPGLGYPYNNTPGMRNSFDGANDLYSRDSPSPVPPPRQNSIPLMMQMQTPYDGSVHRPGQSDNELNFNQQPPVGMESPSPIRNTGDTPNAHAPKPERPSLFGTPRDRSATRPSRPILNMEPSYPPVTDSPAHRRPNLNFDVRSPPQRDNQSPGRFRDSPSPGQGRPSRDCSSPGLSRPRQSPSPGTRSAFLVGPAFAMVPTEPPPTPPRRPSLGFNENTFPPQQGKMNSFENSQGAQHDNGMGCRTGPNFGPSAVIPQGPSPGRPEPDLPAHGPGGSDSPVPPRRPSLNLPSQGSVSSPQLNRPGGRPGRPTLQIGSQRDLPPGSVAFGGTLGSFPGFGGSFGSPNSYSSPSPSPSPSGAPSGALGRPSSAGNLSFGSPVSSNRDIMRRRFQLPGSPQASKPPESAEIEMKYQEIMKQSGILTIDNKKIPTDINDLGSLGELGHGTCGHVVKMVHRQTGYCMAVKQMRRSGNRDENKRIIMDLDVVIKSHNCPYIVQCLGTFITSSDVWICMELMNTCLEKLLKRSKQPLPERILGKVAMATVNALNYLKEEHGVIHRDIKPSNILLDERGRILLCDFGISGRLVDSKAKTRSAGCAAYMAPERIDPPDPTKPDYDIRADVWSLGISLVELATAEFPYTNCKTDFEVLAKVLQEDPPMLPPGKGFSLNFCSFVSQCLTKDYKKRPKYRKLLEHPFIGYYTKLHVDVAAWFTDVQLVIAQNTPTPSPSPITPKYGF